MKIIITLKGQSVMVDDDLYDYLNKFKWTHNKFDGVFRHLARRRIKLSRTVARMNVLTDRHLSIYYVDGDPFNCQRVNLIAMTRQRSSQNNPPKKKSNNAKTIYKGVSYIKEKHRVKRWRVCVYHNGTSKTLGYFHTDKIAAVAYNRYMKALLGDEAVLNKVEGLENYY